MKLKPKALLTIIVMMLLLSIFQITSLANSEDVLIVKQSDDSYLIYVQNMLNKEFEFAFSNSQEETNLNYIRFDKDNSGNNIAYVDNELKDEFFNSEHTYIWVRSDGRMIIEGEQINLNYAKTVDELNKNKNLTKNITVESTAESAKIKINGSENKTYYYQFATKTSSDDYNKLLDLINEISSYDENTDMFKKIQNQKKLNELYDNLVASLDESWVEAENLEITKPYEAKENQQYILWLKDSEGNIDIQFLTAYEKTIPQLSEKTVTETVASILPVTYDDTLNLYIALGGVIIAIIAICIYKKIKDRNTKKEQ